MLANQHSSTAVFAILVYKNLNKETKNILTHNMVICRMFVRLCDEKLFSKKEGTNLFFSRLQLHSCPC